MPSWSTGTTRRPRSCDGQLPTQLAVARLVNPLKGVCARRLAALPGANPLVVPIVLRRVGRWDPMGDAQGVQPQPRNPDPAAACSFLAAAVVVGGRGLLGATPPAYAAGAAMAVVGTALAIAAFLAGMARVGSAWASIASSFEPVFTVALGAAVLGDRLGPGKVVGGLAVVAGAVLPLLGGAREAVGSTVRGAEAYVDGVSSPMVSSKPRNAATRGSTRR